MKYFRISVPHALKSCLWIAQALAHFITPKAAPKSLSLYQVSCSISSYGEEEKNPEKHLRMSFFEMREGPVVIAKAILPSKG